MSTHTVKTNYELEHFGLQQQLQCILCHIAPMPHIVGDIDPDL